MYEDRMKYRTPVEVQFGLENPKDSIDSIIHRIEAQLRLEENELNIAGDELEAHMKAEKWIEKSAPKAEEDEYFSIRKKIARHTQRMTSLNRQLLSYKDIKEGRVLAVSQPR